MSRDSHSLKVQDGPDILLLAPLYPIDALSALRVFNGAASAIFTFPSFLALAIEETALRIVRELAGGARGHDLPLMAGFGEVCIGWRGWGGEVAAFLPSLVENLLAA